MTVTVREWSATVAPVLLGIDWDRCNGDHLTGSGPGSEAHPSARYTHETQCECTVAVTVTVTATWGGTVTLDYPLLDTPIVQPATGVPFTSSTAYTVIEREAVVVG